jgi:hypothetical protein
MTQTLLGLDLGSIKIAVAAVQTGDASNGSIIEKRSIPTPRVHSFSSHQQFV